MLDLFSGDTLEEAMAEAVAALGPGLEVRSARKVRSGVRGLVGRPVFEVLAASPGTEVDGAVAPDLEVIAAMTDLSETDGDAQMMAQIMAEEEPASFGAELGSASSDLGLSDLEIGLQEFGAELGLELGAFGEQLARTAGDETGRHQQEEETVGDDVVQEAVSRLLAQADEHDIAPRPAARPSMSSAMGQRAAARPLRPVPHPDHAVAQHTPVYAARSASRPVPPPAPASRPAPAAPASPVSGTGWSRSALRRLGVPAAILDEMPVVDPTDDWGWMAALTDAIARVVPAPVEPGPDNPVVVSAFGLRGALVILDMGARGTAPGTITAGGRTTPATAMELALVLHTTLTGR